MESRLKELHSDLFETKLHYKGYKLWFLSQVFIAENFMGSYRIFNLINVIKRFGLENILKYFLYKSSNLFNKKPTRRSAKFLFVNEVNNQAVVHTLNCVREKFNSKEALTVFSDTRLRERGTMSFNIFEMLTFKNLAISILDGITLLFSLGRFKSEIKLISRKYNISRISLVLNLFDSILLINLTKIMFSKTGIQRIVLMTDVHKLSRIIVLTAKQLEIKCFVIQHGATIGEEGYLPIIADQILVWGEGSKNWFTERKQSAEKIVIMGSPRMDSMIYQINNDINIVPRMIRKILVILSDITVEELYLKKIRDAFQMGHIKDVELTIKLHPGGSVDYSFIPEKIFNSSGLLYKIARFENINLLLNQTDIVFVTNSTVGMEAITWNKPIFQYKSNEILDYRMSYEDFDCSHIFTTSEDVSKVLLNTKSIFSKLQNYPAFVEHSFKKLDGQASKRIKDFIVNSSTD